MRHVVVDEWSRRNSVLHRRNPRAKAISLLLILVAIALTPLSPLLCVTVALLVAGVALAHLPVRAYLQRTLTVLPFAGLFALMTALQGDTGRAVGLVVRAWLSAAAILILIGTTALPVLMHAINRLGVPRLLVDVIQFVYRYLFVIAEQAWRMRQAAASRGGGASLRAAAGTITSLFARSYARAENVHRAMLARGYTGEPHAHGREVWSAGDVLLLAAAGAPVAALMAR